MQLPCQCQLEITWQELCMAHFWDILAAAWPKKRNSPYTELVLFCSTRKLKWQSSSLCRLVICLATSYSVQGHLRVFWLLWILQWPLSIAMAVQQKQLAPTVLKCFSVTYVTLQHITAVSVAVLVLQKLCNVQWEMVTVATQPCYVWKWPLPWQPKAFVAFRTSSHYYLFGFSQSKGVETCLGNWERKMELRQTLEIPAYCMDKQYSPVLHWAGFYFLSYSTAIELWFCLKKIESESRGEGGFFYPLYQANPHSENLSGSFKC